MKKLLVVYTAVFLLFASFVHADVAFVEREAYTPEGTATGNSIVYYENGLIIIKMTDKEFGKSIVYHKDIHWEILSSFKNFTGYLVTLEANGVKSFTKVIGKVSSAHVSNPNYKDGIYEFTIHVSPDGQSKLIVESSEIVGYIKTISVYNLSEVGTIISLMHKILDMQKELAEKISR
jgi:hypothetical protein|tara:strand:- start:263 stop:793 length:531 start_codon:yes stop_codon:yes gene_type:complete